METEEAYFGDFDYAVGIINHLVDDEKGCPWDKVQTHHTLKRYLLEETFELFEAIDNEDDWHMIEEQETSCYKYYYTQVLAKRRLHGYKRSDTKPFRKMIRRHPHVLVTQKQKLKKI